MIPDSLPQFDQSPRPMAAPPVETVMLSVIMALMPGTLAQIWHGGPWVLIQCGLAVFTALTAEAAALKLRGRPTLPSLMDGSAIVTAILLALSIPCLAPWWIITLGTLFAILLGKQVYGGLGQNPFNPAMVGYAILLISFPQQMTDWPVDSAPLDAVLQAILGGGENPRPDAVAMATPLDAWRTGLSMRPTPAGASWKSAFDHGAGWVNLGYLLGGLWLLRLRFADWRIPLSYLGALTLLALSFHLADDARYPGPGFELLNGATMLGAFFIATDPVSAATTPRGRWIYGAGIGVLVYVIRTWGGYPDGVAFAVLLMNLSAPTLDHFTRPRAYGHPR